MRGLDAGVAAVIRIDALWLAVKPMDMRAGPERLLARVVQVFGQAQAHHGYLFANARATRIKLLVHDVRVHAVRHRHFGYRCPRRCALLQHQRLQLRTVPPAQDDSLRCHRVHLFA